MANTLLSNAFGSGGGIKSVQRGTVDMQGKTNASPANVTVTAVDTTKAFLIAEPFINFSSANVIVNGKLNSGTSIQFTPTGTVISGTVIPLNWQLVEFV